MNQGMIRKLQKIQKEMEETQRELEETVFIGNAGGMVTVHVTGDKLLQEIKINPECLNPEDADLVQDTIVAAMADAMTKIAMETEKRMSKYTAMMPNIPF